MVNMETKQKSVWLSTQHNEPILSSLGKQVDCGKSSTCPKKGRILFSMTHR